VFEFTTRQLFAGFLKNVDLLFVFIVLWRVISYYFNVLLGALVVIRVLRIRKETLNEEEQAIEQSMKKTPEQDLADP
jgi:uncharacterized membrane protein YbhN (UPF0104 family)